MVAALDALIRDNPPAPPQPGCPPLSSLNRTDSGDPVAIHTHRAPQLGDQELLSITIQALLDRREWDLESSCAQRWTMELEIVVLARLLDAFSTGTPAVLQLDQVVDRIVAKLAPLTVPVRPQNLPENVFEVRVNEVEYETLTSGSQDSSSSKPHGLCARLMVEMRYQRYPGENV